MDARCSDSNSAPPLLFETLPLTYFGVGDLAYFDFFASFTGQAHCGLVLDIGYVWTVYRYSGRWRTQTVGEFMDEMLTRFPLSHVVQIHITGLANHPNDIDVSNAIGTFLSPWIDAHGAKISQSA